MSTLGIIAVSRANSGYFYFVETEYYYVPPVGPGACYVAQAGLGFTSLKALAG